MGPAVAGIARRGGNSHVAKRVAAQVAERLERAHAVGAVARQMAQIETGIIDISGDLAEAMRARDAIAAAKIAARKGIEAFRAQAESRQAIAKLEQSARDAIVQIKSDLALRAQAEQRRIAASAKELERQRQVAVERDNAGVAERGPVHRVDAWNTDFSKCTISRSLQ